MFLIEKDLGERGRLRSIRNCFLILPIGDFLNLLLDFLEIFVEECFLLDTRLNYGHSSLMFNFCESSLIFEWVTGWMLSCSSVGLNDFDVLMPMLWIDGD